MSPRLLNTSPEEPDSDLWRLRGLTGDNAVLTSELCLGEEDSQFRGAEEEGRLMVDTGERMSYGQAGWIQGHAGGHLRLVEEDESHGLSQSKTAEESGHPIEEVDFSAWTGHIHSRISQKGQSSTGVSKDSRADGSSKNGRPTGEDSSNLTGQSRGATVKVYYGEGSGMNSGEGREEAGETLGQGGGAFMLFRRDPAKQQSTAPSSPHKTVS